MNPEETKSLENHIFNITTEIGAKLDAERPPWEPSDHSRNNWASGLHHPCLKNLVHGRVDWEEQEGIDIDGRWRVDEGKRIEREVSKWLGDIHFSIEKSQTRLSTDGKEGLEDVHLSGRIDGIIEIDWHKRLKIDRKKVLPYPYSKLKEIIIEVKTVNPNYWNSTKTIADLKRHKSWWIQKIPSQLNAYLAMNQDPVGLLIIVTFGKKPRILPMLFDQDLWDLDSSRLRKVNAHVEAGTYPEPIPFDAQICGMCDFHHLCNPLQTTKMSEIEPNDIFMLNIYLEQKEAAERFKETHAELIGDKKKPGKYRGMEAVIEDIDIKTRTFMKQDYKMTKEDKEPFRTGESEVIITTIERRGV